MNYSPAFAKKFTDNLKKVNSILGHTGVTTGEELHRFASHYFGNHYLGIFSEHDHMPPLPTNTFMVVNKPNNVHWISIMNLNGKLYDFDSYGRPMTRYKDFNTQHDLIPDQGAGSPDVGDCGLRTMAMMASIFNVKL